MSSYIDGLAARALGISQHIQPRVPSLFEPIRAMPGLLDAEVAEDKLVEPISSADDMNHQLAIDSRPVPTSKNELSIESSHRPAIAPTQVAKSSHESSLEDSENKPVESPGALGYVNPGGLKDQATHFEQASGSIGINQVNSDIVASAADGVKANEYANKRNKLSNVPSSKLDRKQIKAVHDGIDNETVESVIDVNPSFNDRERAELSAIKILSTRRLDVPGHANPEGSDSDIDTFQHTNTENKLSNLTSAEVGQASAKAIISQVANPSDNLDNDKLHAAQLSKGNSSSDQLSSIKPPTDHKLSIDPIYSSNLPKTANISLVRSDLMRSDTSHAPETTGQPVVKVTIGRIEVKAVLPLDKKVQRPSPRAKSTSLEEYLRSIRGGSR